MPVICVIEFDNNPYGIYYAGQVVSGKVTLQTEEVKKVNAVSLKITGFAHTSWSESKSSSSGSSSSNHYSGHEVFFESTTYLMGLKEGTPFNIESGIYNYDFSCQIPMACPSSFEGLYGHIRYIVTVAIVRPWKFDDTFNRVFTVSEVMGSNCDNPLLHQLVTAEASNTFGFGPWKTDPLAISVSSPQSVYMPGQIIPIDVLIKNESDVRVEEIKASLVMHICHYDQPPSSKTKNQRIKVIKSKGEGVQRYCTKNYKYELLIPATPPTCLNLCRIIKITYMLEVEAKVSGWHANQVVCIPITIGNIPPVIQQQQPTCDAEWQSNAAGVCSTLTEKECPKETNDIEKTAGTVLEQHNYKNAPPPSFKEAVNDKLVSSEAEAGSTKELNVQAENAPPTFEEAMHMPESNAASTSNYTVDQKLLDFQLESGSQQALPFEETTFNIQEPAFGYNSTAIFEEAVHLTHANPIRNAFSPRYPVFRHLIGPIVPHAVECTEDLNLRTYNKNK